MLKKIQKLILAFVLLANIATPALGLPANSKKNHALLNGAILFANIVIPSIPNAIDGIRERKEDPSKAINGPSSWSISYKHLIDLYNLFKEGETPKIFKQKWAEFSQTHKTSAWLIRAQLAALAFSGACGAWTQRYRAIIAKCYVTGDVFLKRVHDSSPLPHLSKVTEKSRDGRALWFPYGFMWTENCNENRTETQSLLIFYVANGKFKRHPAYRTAKQ